MVYCFKICYFPIILVLVYFKLTYCIFFRPIYLLTLQHNRTLQEDLLFGSGKYIIINHSYSIIISHQLCIVIPVVVRYDLESVATL